MSNKKIIIVLLVLVVAGFAFYLSVLYPAKVKRTCKQAMLTFPKESQEQFYRNCVAESGVNPD